MSPGEHLYALRCFNRNPGVIMSTDEEKRWSEARRVKEEVEPELLRRPEVTGVDVGYKDVGGLTTDIVAIRVYVARKQDVPPEEAIPKMFQRVPTDVVERRFVL